MSDDDLSPFQEALAMSYRLRIRHFTDGALDPVEADDLDREDDDERQVCP